MARQLNDMKQGTRKGLMSALMTPVVKNLTSEDILNIVAYIASLPAPSRLRKIGLALIKVQIALGVITSESTG